MYQVCLRFVSYRAGDGSTKATKKQNRVGCFPFQKTGLSQRLFKHLPSPRSLLLFFMGRKKSLCEMQPCSVSSTRSLSRTIVCAVVGRAKTWPCSGFMFVILSEQQGLFNTRISRSGMCQVGKFLVFPNIKHFIYMKRVWNETFSGPHASSWKTKCGMCQGPKLEE